MREKAVDARALSESAPRPDGLKEEGLKDRLGLKRKRGWYEEAQRVIAYLAHHMILQGFANPYIFQKEQRCESLLNLNQNKFKHTVEGEQERTEGVREGGRQRKGKGK